MQDGRGKCISRDNGEMSGIDPFNLSEGDFDAVMMEIDTELRHESDRIIGREVRGWFKYCIRFGINAPFGDDPTNRIIDWFKAMYGDRLNLDLDFGTSVILIRGDPYRVRCFRCFGHAFVVCSAAIAVIKLCKSNPDPPVVNLIDDCIEGLTVDLTQRLSGPELKAILEHYRLMFVAFSAMEFGLSSRYGGTDAPYMKEAMDDLKESSESLLLRVPNYGQSNWASLQATEKVLKSFILEKGSTHGKIHKLAELCAAASSLGLPEISPVLIDVIQRSPSVPYDSSLVTKKQAYTAHEAALIVCGLIAPHITRSTAKAVVRGGQLNVSGISAIDALRLEYHSPVPPFYVNPPKR